MRVAADNQVSNRTIEALEKSGHIVVVMAGDRADYDWLGEAHEKHADIYISPDSDVENFALNHSRSYIKLPQGLKSGLLTDFVLQRVNAAEKIKKLYKEYPEIIVCRG